MVLVRIPVLSAIDHDQDKDHDPVRDWLRLVPILPGVSRQSQSRSLVSGSLGIGYFIDMANIGIIEARVSHVYQTQAEKVFDAWLDPQIIAQWMFGPNIRDEEIVSIEVDPKVGGEFSFLVKRGTLVIDHIGTYLKIEKPTALEFNWGVKGMKDSSTVRIQIVSHDSGCKLNLVHELDPAWKDYLQRSIDGWGDMLKVLEKALRSS